MYEWEVYNYCNVRSRNKRMFIKIRDLNIAGRYIYILIFISNLLFCWWEKKCLYHLQILQTDIWGKKIQLHAGHCWRSRDELLSDVLLWTPAYSRAKARRPARTYKQLLCEDTECSPEDLPGAINNREEWRERDRDICAGGTIW